MLNLLAGNTINLSSKNIVISSDSLNIGEDGSMTFKVNGLKILQIQNSDNNAKSTGEPTNEYVQNLGEAKYVNSDKNGIFEFDLSFEFLSLLDSITAEITPVPVEKALGYFYFLISYNGKERSKFENRYVEAAKNYISINISRPITVTEIASAVGINDRYLYNLFIKHEKLSPKQYLLNLKLSRAALMLKSSRITISEIAEHCGFSDVLAFSRFFSKREGISPSEYRRTYLKNEIAP